MGEITTSGQERLRLLMHIDKLLSRKFVPVFTLTTMCGYFHLALPYCPCLSPSSLTSYSVGRRNEDMRDFEQVYLPCMYLCFSHLQDEDKNITHFQSCYED